MTNIGERQHGQGLGRTIERAFRNNTQLRERMELTALNDHLLADVGCGQKSAERAAAQMVRNRIMQVPPI